MSGLYRLVYVSRAESEADGEEAAVEKIVAASIRNNRAAAITGYLLGYRGDFVQALEGPMEAVLATYARITADPRHGQLRVLGSRPVKTRVFAEWDMCARTLSRPDDLLQDRLDDDGRLDLHRLTAEDALALLATVADVRRRLDLTDAA